MTLFAASGASEISAEAFAKHFFSLLGVPFEERESIHYVEGGYYKGVYNEVTFTVFADDVRNQPNMPLGIAAEGADETAINSAVDFIIRLKLMPEGYKFLQYARGGRWVDFS